MDKLIAAGKELSLEGEELRKFVMEQLALEREDRATKAASEKLRLEAEREESLRQLKIKKLELELARAGTASPSYLAEESLLDFRLLSMGKTS